MKTTSRDGKKTGICADDIIMTRDQIFFLVVLIDLDLQIQCVLQNRRKVAHVLGSLGPLFLYAVLAAT
jgi:hypothetical protein